MSTVEALLGPARRHMRQAPDLRLYALFDASAHPDLPGKLWELMSAPQYAALLMDLVDDAPTVLAGPWLVEASFDCDWTHWFADQLQTQTAGYFMATRAPLDELARELRDRLFITLPDGRPGLFRFYDPRTLLPYWMAASNAARLGILGPIEVVWGFDLLSSTAFELKNPGMPSPLPAPRKIQLEPSQMAAMARYNEPFHMVQYLRTNHPDLFDKIDSQALLAKLHQDLLPKLDALHITDAGSRLLFTLLNFKQIDILTEDLLAERPWEAMQQTFAQWVETEAKYSEIVTRL